MATRSDPSVFDAHHDSGAQLVGVAIEIPEPFRTELHAMRVAVGDPAARVMAPHITLVPPTRVNCAEFRALEPHLSAAAAAHDGFEVELCGMDSFRPVSPVVFARIVTGAEDCARLERAIRSGPLAVPIHFAYHPHVTVAHHLPDGILDAAANDYADFHVRFDVRSFECSAWSGSDWVVQRMFELGA